MRKIERTTDGRNVNPAVTAKPKREKLEFFGWLVLAYWCAYDLWAFWTGRESGNASAAGFWLVGFWLVAGLIVTRMALRAAFGRRVER